MLKIGECDHSDAGQMNVYLNYYKDNEFTNGDNDPIGIILCSGKNEATACTSSLACNAVLDE